MSVMKSKSNNKKVIASIKVKEEKIEKSEGNELKELSHYIDDRIGLMHQVFLTIKPNKLKSMAPDCLKHMDIDKIKELCLEEVLGISTKRLKSIIQGTECPSDTNSDSDVGEIIEHISLEEISSDDSVTFMSDEDKNSKTTEPVPNKEMTVLELVELQARARAIRSQLALEPVKQEIVDAKSKPKLSKTDIQKPVQKEQKRIENNSTENTSAGPSPTKLIRNYRSRQPITAPNNNANKSDSVINSVNEALTSNETIDASAENEEGEIESSDTERSLKEIVTAKRKKKTKSKSKALTSKDVRIRRIEATGKNNLTVNVSFSDVIEKDEDEINLYVSDTEKEQLLSGVASTQARRPSNDSESSISIIDLNNSPLVISSESENDFQDVAKNDDAPDEAADVKEEIITEADKESSTSHLANDASTTDAHNLRSEVPVDETLPANDETCLSDDDDVLEENTDWKTRWMNSDKVKKVLVTSKLCSNVMKKQKSIQKSNETTENEDSAENGEETNVETDFVQITGSVEEFKKLSGLPADASLAADEKNVSETEENVTQAQSST